MQRPPLTQTRSESTPFGARPTQPCTTLAVECCWSSGTLNDIAYSSCPHLSCARRLDAVESDVSGSDAFKLADFLCPYTWPGIRRVLVGHARVAIDFRSIAKGPDRNGNHRGLRNGSLQCQARVRFSTARRSEFGEGRGTAPCSAHLGIVLLSGAGGIINDLSRSDYQKPAWTIGRMGDLEPESQIHLQGRSKLESCILDRP